MLTFLILALIIGAVFLGVNQAINIFLSPKDLGNQTSILSSQTSAYECGFLASTDQSRVHHSLSYYVVGLLYVLFDIEIAVLFPGLVAYETIGSFGVVFLLVFVYTLVLGFVYELYTGLLI